MSNKTTHKLRKITFTGIDKKTDVKELIDFTKAYPKTEFGFLAHVDQHSLGNRFCNPLILQDCQGAGLSLSLHLCGKLAYNLLYSGDWSNVLTHMGDMFYMFDRIQLNVSGCPAGEKWMLTVPESVSEIIIQQRNVDKMPAYRWYLKEKESVRGAFSVLLDTSGGRGQYSGIPRFADLPYAGYAGGFGPDNVSEIIQALEASTFIQNYWIDMETKVRDKRDWFSLELCREVCENSGVYAK